MTRDQFCRNVAARAGFCIKDVKELMKYFEEEVLYVIKTEDEIRFAFGNIGGKHVDEHDAIMPKTGEHVVAKERYGVPYYKADFSLKGWVSKTSVPYYLALYDRVFKGREEDKLIDDYTK